MSDEQSGELITQAEAAERRLAEHTPAPPALPADTRDDGPLMAAIQKAASDPNFDVEKLRALREIQKEWNAEQAKNAYDDALARAQAVMPIVKKNKHVYFEGKDGKPATDYHHADYGSLVAAVKGALTSEGFSWDHKIVQDVTGDGHKITVTCILKRSGHSETVTMFAPPEGSPGMNIIQKIKSTTTYLKRATLEAVCGAATEDDDDDGRGASGPPAPITTAQLATLNATIEELEADRPEFIAWLNKRLKIEIEDLGELPVDGYAIAVQALEAKRKAVAREQEEAGGEAQAAPAEEASPDDINDENPLLGG